MNPVYNGVQLCWDFMIFFLVHRYQLASNGSLLVSDVTDKRQETDAGYYQCSAAVDDGQTIVSRKAKVEIAGTVLVKPVLSSHSKIPVLSGCSKIPVLSSHSKIPVKLAMQKYLS